MREAHVSFIGIAILMYLYRWLGRGVCRFCVAFVVACAYPFLTKARKASAEYRCIWSEFTGRPFPGSGFRHILSFAFAMADRIAIWQGIANPETIPEDDAEALERSRRHYAEKRGCFMMTAHAGNYELMHAYYATRGSEDASRIHAYVDLKISQSFNELLNSLTDKRGVCLHSIENMGVGSAMEMLQNIERGDLLIMTGERSMSHGPKNTLSLPFLGKQAPFPKGVARCAAMLKCPVYTFFVMEEKGRYHLHCYELSDGSADADTIRRRYIEQLERMLVRYPLNWYNFYSFWS